MKANAGVSKVTENKQKFLETFVEYYGSNYAFIYDTQAGPGLYKGLDGKKIQFNCGNKTNVSKGSPIIFGERVSSNCKIYAVEKNVKTFKLLQHHTIDYSNVHALLGTQEEMTPFVFNRTKDKECGLVYIDPNGSFNWDIMHNTFSKHYNTDFLINVSSVSLLRQARVYGKKHANIGLQMAKLNRKNWYLNIPKTKSNSKNWMRLFATNDYGSSIDNDLDMIPIGTKDILQVFCDLFDSKPQTLSKYIKIEASSDVRSKAAIKANQTRKKLAEVLKSLRKGHSGVKISKKVGVPLDYVYKVRDRYLKE